MTSYILYLLAGSLLLASFFKDKNKTKKSLRIAWKSFIKLLPSAFSIMLIVGITLAVFDEQFIVSIIGPESGVFGAILALIIGSITLIPSFIAFPLGGALLEAGAGYMQIAALVSTVMAVGIVTLPAEIKYFNKSIAIKRNLFALLISIIFTVVIGLVM